MTALGPLVSLFGFGAVNGLAEVTKMLFDMETIDDLNGSGKEFVGDLPDPRCTVAEDHGALGGGKAAPCGLAQHALRERGWDFIGSQRGGALNRRRVGNRTLVAYRTVLGVACFRAPDSA